MTLVREKRQPCKTSCKRRSMGMIMRHSDDCCRFGTLMFTELHTIFCVSICICNDYIHILIYIYMQYIFVGA